MPRSGPIAEFRNPTGCRKPALPGQLAVPGQQRTRRDQPMGPQHGWQLPGQCREDGTVGPIRLGPGDLTPEHRDLMAENHDFRVFGRLAAAEQHQPAEDPGHDQVKQAKRHKPRSCRNQPIRPNSRSQYLMRVLKRYRQVYVRHEVHFISAADRGEIGRLSLDPMAYPDPNGIPGDNTVQETSGHALT